MSDIFVNYRTGYGEQAATHIEDHLSRRFGSDRVFRDAKSIDPGDNFQVRLNTATINVRALLVVIGEGWASAPHRDGGGRALDDPTDWIRREILNARGAGARIIPVLCGHNMNPPAKSELPPELEFLADHQALRFDHRNAEYDLAQITDRLGRLVPGLADNAQGDAGGVHNSNAGQAENVVQLRDLNGNLTVGGTSNNAIVNGDVSGPLHTGSGDLNVHDEPDEEHR